MAGPSEEALIQAIMDVRSQVDFLWQFFVSVHIAIFALLLLYDHAVETLSAIAKALTVAGIAAFEWINGNALVTAYTLLDSMHEQYRLTYGQANRFHYTFYEHFVLATFQSRPSVVLVTHSTALVIVLLAFASRRFIQNQPAKQQRP